MANSVTLTNADAESSNSQKQVDDARQVRDVANQDYLKARTDLRNFQVAHPGPLNQDDAAKLAALQSAARSPERVTLKRKIAKTHALALRVAKAADRVRTDPKDAEARNLLERLGR